MELTFQRQTHLLLIDSDRTWFVIIIPIKGQSWKKQQNCLMHILDYPKNKVLSQDAFQDFRQSQNFLHFGKWV